MHNLVLCTPFAITTALVRYEKRELKPQGCQVLKGI